MADREIDSTRALNRASYDAIAAAWDAARTSLSGPEQRYLDVLLAGLPVPSRVLDLGCGTGRPIAEYVLAHGHAVTGVDQAEALLARARVRLPHGTWITAAIESFTTTERFDAIVCWDTLFHIDRALHATLLARFAALLGSGGRLMLTVGGSEHPAFTDTMFGATFFYDSHPPAQTRTLLEDLGFVPLISEFINPPTTGRDKGRYALVARKG